MRVFIQFIQIYAQNLRGKFLFPIKLDWISLETMRRQKLQKPHFRNRIYSLSALLYRHLGFIMMAPPALGMRQQSSIPISMTVIYRVSQKKTEPA